MNAPGDAHVRLRTAHESLARTMRQKSAQYREWADEAAAAGKLDEYRKWAAEADKCARSATRNAEMALRQTTILINRELTHA